MPDLNLNRFALITPLPLLSLYGALTHVHLLLAHLVRYPEYRNHYRRCHFERGDFIIMDNGCAENGRSIDGAALVHAANEVSADEIVAPDVLGDAEATISRTLGFVRVYGALLKCKSLMVVPQGSTDEEWLWCADQLLRRVPYDVTIGMPKRLDYNRGGEGRKVLVKFLHAEHPEARTHLLGAGRNLKNDLGLIGKYGVRSMDSALPLVLAQHGQVLTSEQDREWSLQLDFYKSADPDLAERNTRVLTEWLQNGDDPRSSCTSSG